MDSEIIDSEKVGVSGVMSIDDAKKRNRVTGDRAEKLEKQIIEKQDILFKDIMCVTFGWKVQEDGTKKLVSKLPNGKILFPDRSEKLEEIEPGVPYLCLVYEREREGFAKIICEEYQPKIFVTSSRIPYMVYRDENGKIRRVAPHGNTYEDRIVYSIKKMEELGFPSVRIIFRKNER